MLRNWVHTPPPLEGLGEVLHTADDAEGGGDGREDADNQLDDELDGFFFHGDDFLVVRGEG